MNWIRIVIFLILFFITIPTAGAADNKRIMVRFGNGPADPQVKAIEKNGVKYVNLPFLNIYLHVISKWDPDTGNIELHFGKLSLVMAEDSVKYTVAGVEKRLSAPTFKKDDQLWFPVDFLKQWGIEAQAGKTDELLLDWAENYLLGIENITYQNRPAYLLIGSKTLTVKESNLLVNPDRLMIDFYNLKVHPAFDGQITANLIVKAIRVGERDGTNLRLVFDLTRLTGYKVIRNSDGARQSQDMIIVFNGLVEDAKFIQKGAVRKIQISTSLPTEFKMTTASEPNRILIDLDGVTLKNGATRLPGDGKWVSAVRIAQFDPQTVRVVLDLLDRIPCYVIQAPDNPNLLEVRTVQTINNISWSDGAGGELTISGDGELVESVRKLKKPEQLQIDLDYFRFAAELRAPVIKNPLIKAIRLVPLTDTKVRIEVDLGDYLVYDVQTSGDHRRLVIHFRLSVLLKKIMVLDAGHGGVDTGTCGGQGTREKDFTLDVTLRLKELLEDAGAYVILTRSDDSYVGLFERPLIANNLYADLFISIHCNSYSDDRNIRGVEIYYWPHTGNQNTPGKLLAGQVMAGLTRETKMQNRGIRANNYAVLAETQMPGILVELGYLSNYQEETMLSRNEFKDNASRGIFQGIVAYYSK